MSPLLHAIAAGLSISILKFTVIELGLSQWNLTFVSISGLIAGIFFILAMIFQTALRDYKQADLAISTIRAKCASLQDVACAAANQSKGAYAPTSFSNALIELLITLKKYAKSNLTFLELQKQVDTVQVHIYEMDEHLSQNQVATFNQLFDKLRTELSFLSYARTQNFAKIGYVFLTFFIVLIITLQLFSHSNSDVLSILFIFSLTFVLVFFEELIRDLDNPYERKYAAFMLDTLPLDNAVKQLKQSLQSFDERSSVS